MRLRAPAKRLFAAHVCPLIAALVTASSCGTLTGSDESSSGGDSLGPGATWSQNGVFVWHPSAFPADHFKDRVVGNGFRWVAVQVHEGASATNEAELDTGWIRRWREAGVSVGGWGYNATEPEAEAALAATLVDRWGLDFYIANAEIDYKYTAADGSWSPEAYGRSQRFVTAFRARKPALPVAVSSYGRADRTDIHWAVWRDAGFHFLPQAYWNEYDFLDPVACVDGAVASGWPKAMVHPTIGIWGGGARGVVTGAEYAARLAIAGTTGFSIYLGEVTPDADWAALRSNTASTPPPPPSGGCTNRCTLDARECLDGDRYRQCADWDGNGCTEWSGAFSCGTSWPGTVCGNGGWCIGTSPGVSCSDQCSNGARECLDGDQYRECKDWDGDGCTEWRGPWGCSASWPGTWCRSGWCVAS